VHLTRTTRSNSDFHAGTWPRGNVHGIKSSCSPAAVVARLWKGQSLTASDFKL